MICPPPGAAQSLARSAHVPVVPHNTYPNTDFLLACAQRAREKSLSFSAWAGVCDVSTAAGLADRWETNVRIFPIENMGVSGWTNNDRECGH